MAAVDGPLMDSELRGNSMRNASAPSSKTCNAMAMHLERRLREPGTFASAVMARKDRLRMSIGGTASGVNKGIVSRDLCTRGSAASEKGERGGTKVEAARDERFSLREGKVAVTTSAAKTSLQAQSTARVSRSRLGAGMQACAR